jgi:N-acetylgalactosamine kinase
VCLESLRSGDMVGFGELMGISHNGDRVVRTNPESPGNGSQTTRAYVAPTSDDYLRALVEDLESGDPVRVTRAQLHRQPGSYRCSTPELDLMVDIAQQTEGVLGAQLAGAGLGGCIMALAREDSTDQLLECLDQLYYQPRKLDPQVSVCIPIAGSGVLSPGGDDDLLA